MTYLIVFINFIYHSGIAILPKRISKIWWGRPFVGVILLLWLAIFYGRPPQVTEVARKYTLRLAFFPNLTHAPALIGVQRGDFAKALKDTTLKTTVFANGPEAMEALLANAIDVAFVGPSPAINTWQKTKGKALTILAGVCSGGAALITRKGVTIQSLRDLDGKRVGVPQLGGTQDISLRGFMQPMGLRPLEKGGTVTILPMKPADMLPLFKRQQLDAAWIPEPWVARLMEDTGATLSIDERTLWDQGRFTTTLLVVRREYLEKNREQVEALLEAHVRVVNWMKKHPEEAKKRVNEELKRLTTKALPDNVLQKAWARMTFTTDPQIESLMKQAQMAVDAGYLKALPDSKALWDEQPLSAAQRRAAIP